jgi:acyl-CoA synthetase (AMP-forming)/AMP-acid ligase II
VNDPAQSGPCDPEAVRGSIAHVLDGSLAARPDADALVGRSARLTYRELDEAADRSARALHALGVRPGDRVAVSLPNDVDIVIAFHGAMRLGATWVGLNRALAAPEKEFILDDSDATLVLVEPAVADQLRSRGGDAARRRRIVIVEPGDVSDGRGGFASPADDVDLSPCERQIDPLGAPAVFAYTSGTTGRPKAVVHTQHNLLLPAAVLVAERGYGPTLRKGDCLPLTIPNLLVLTTLLTSQAGGTCIVMDRLDAKGIATWIRDERVTTWNGVPALLSSLVSEDSVTREDLATLEEVWSGGDACPESIRRRFADKFGVEPTSTYGLTEAPTIVSIDDVGRPGAHPGSSGRPLPHVAVTIRDDADEIVPVGVVAEVCVGPSRCGTWGGQYTPMLRYHGHRDATASQLRDGVLRTGDLGSIDTHGHLTIHSRRTALIIRGGANVYPAEVERVILDVAGVVGCAVFGIADERLGQRVAAAVEVVGDPAAVRQAIRDACASELAREKVPEHVVVVDRLPRNPMGKVSRSELPQLLEQPS